jgi:hypothetical protein
MKKSVAAISLSAALIGGGAVGVALGLPGTSGAETPDTTAVTAAPSTSDAASTPTTASAAATAPATDTPKSNEDPAHEAAESAEREAEEDSGTFHDGHHGDHKGGSNEDPAHEAAESPEREAEEDAAAQATVPTTPSTTVAPSNA